MLPRTGLRWSSQTVGIGRRRIETISARNFSSSRAIKASPFLSTTNAFPRTNTSSIPRTALLLQIGAGIRFASTAAAAPIAPSPATPTPAPVDATSASAANVPTSAPDLAPTSFDNALDLSAESLLDMPEQIGYLNAIGLDHGYGMTSVMQWVLEHIHIYTGQPWWISIVLTAVAVRAVLLKANLNAAENGARLATIKPITDPVNTRMREAMRAGDQTLTMECRAELQRMNARAGVKVWKSFVPMLQIFPAYGIFFTLRAMAELPVPGMETGGALWFYNLTVADPTYLLPLMTAGILHWVLRSGGELGVNTMSPQVYKFFVWGFPALGFLCTFWLPAGVQVSFLASGILSMFQSQLIRAPWFRARTNMTPLPRKASPSTPNLNQSPLKRGPLSSSELGNRFEGPKDEGKKGIKGTFDSLKDAGMNVMGQGKEKMAERAQKQTAKQRQEYELKRREEIKQAQRNAMEERLRDRESRKANRKFGP